jgi:hypothetical protein
MTRDILVDQFTSPTNIIKPFLITSNIIDRTQSNSSALRTHIELLHTLRWPYSLSSETGPVLQYLAWPYDRLIT